MIDREIVTTKLKDIRNYLKELRPLLALPVPEIIGDYLKLRTVERNFQLIVDTMLDINSHLIAVHELPIPDTYQNTFVVLAQHGFLPPELTADLAPVVGLRNKVVHKYGEVNLKKFIADLTAGSTQFEAYCLVIEKLLA